MVKSTRFLGMPPLLAATALFFFAASLPASMFGEALVPAPLAAEEEQPAKFRAVGVTDEGAIVCHREPCDIGCCYLF